MSTDLEDDLDLVPLGGPQPLDVADQELNLVTHVVRHLQGTNIIPKLTIDAWL